MDDRDFDRYMELLAAEDRALEAYVARVRAGLVATAELERVKAACAETLRFSGRFQETELEEAEDRTDGHRSQL